MFSSWASSPFLRASFCTALGLDGLTTISALLLLQDQDRREEVGYEKGSEYGQIVPKVLKAQPLREGADAKYLIPSRWEGQTSHVRHAAKRRHRHQYAREVSSRYHCEHSGGKHRRDLRLREGRNKLPKACCCSHIKQSTKREHQKGPLHRHLEKEHRKQNHDRITDHCRADVGQLLTEQELELCDWRRIKVGDRSRLFLFNDPNSRHDGWDQHQQEHDCVWHFSNDALKRLIVA